MEGQRDKSLKAARLVLQVAQFEQMVGAVEGVLDVSVEHCGIAPQAERVGRAMDVEPLLRVGLVLAYLVAHFGMKDLGAAAGQAAEARVLHLHEDVADRTLGEMAKPVDLDRRPGLQMERRMVVVQQPDDVEIPVVVPLVVQTADDVHLGRAGLDRFLAAGEDLFVAHHVAAGIAEVGTEGAERAPVDADVRGIEVGVDVVPAEVAILPLADEVGQFAQFVQIEPLVPEHLGFRRIEAFPGLDLLADRVERRRDGADHAGGA